MMQWWRVGEKGITLKCMIRDGGGGNGLFTESLSFPGH